jgi:hypothetical protein
MVVLGNNKTIGSLGDTTIKWWLLPLKGGIYRDPPILLILEINFS